MAATVKKLSIKVDLDPYSEMDGKTKRWCLDNRFLKKTLKPIQISEDVEVDTRKWDQKSIGEGIEAVARYEMKVFAVAVTEAMKKLGKAKPSDAADELEGAEAEIDKLYDKLDKDLQKKVLIALDELQAGENDDKKALAAGKQVFQKVESVDFEVVFREIGQNCRLALLGVHDKNLDTLSDPKARKKKDAPEESKDEEKERTKAEQELKKRYIDCTKKLLDLSKNLKTRSGDALAVIEFVENVGKKIAKDKNASDEMKAFGKDMTDARKVFDAYAAAVAQFQKDIDDIVSMVKDQSATRIALARYADSIDPPTDGLKAARAVEDEVKALVRDFRKLEKALA